MRITRKIMEDNPTPKSVTTPDLTNTVEWLLKEKTFVEIIDNFSVDEIKSAAYLVFSGRQTIGDLAVKFATKPYQLAVKLCLIVQLRGKAFHKYVKEPNSKDLIQNLLSTFDIQLPNVKGTSKNNRIETVMAALAPISYVVSYSVNVNVPKRLVPEGRRAYDGELPAGYRWFGSICLFSKNDAPKLLLEYENWTQWYIEVRRRSTSDITDREQVLRIMVNSLIEKSWWGRQIFVFSEECKTKWVSGQISQVELGKDPSDSVKKALEDGTKMPLFKQYTRKPGNSFPEDIVLKQILDDGFLTKEIYDEIMTIKKAKK